MATEAGIEGVEGPIRRLFGDGSASGMDVGELLRRFASGHDPVAMEVLVARFGPMVLGVCRRVLGDRHSSDDAFQATFLILAKKAGAIRDPDRLGPWLHGVAHRVAVRARADLARRKARERPGAEDLAMANPADEAGFDRLELRAALDEEIRKLPEKFRDPIVLCYLDGLTHDEAATRLRCPVGTVRSRLSTGRARLRDRLARRGVAVPTAVFAAALTAEAAPVAVSLPLITSTVMVATAFAGGLAAATAAGTVPATVASLAEGVSTTMILSKLKIVAGLALSGMLTVGLGTVAAYQAGGTGQEPKAEKAEKPATEPDAKSRLARIKETETEIVRLQDERDRVRTELEAAQKRLTTLIYPDGPPPVSQKVEAPSPTTDATLRDQLNEAQTKAERANIQLERAQKDIARLTAILQRTPSEPTKGGRDQRAALKTTTNVVGQDTPTDRSDEVAAKTIATRKDANPPVASATAAASGMGTSMAGGGGGGMGMRAGAMGGMGGMGDTRGMGPVPNSLATIQGIDYVIVHKPGSDKVAAYSATAGEWVSFEVPKGTDVVPIAVPGLVALMATGDKIGRIATFGPTSGKWYPIDLKEPASGKATPIAGYGLASYAIGRRVYAFSATSLSWDVLELPEGAKPTPYLFPSRITVEHDDHIYIFSGKTGKWADFDAGASQPPAPKAN